MTVFVDTSAIYALLATRDRNHERARQIFVDLVDDDALMTTNYVLVETASLIHARHGRKPLRDLRAVFGVIEPVWVDAEVHEAAWARLAGRGRRGPSLVDFVSFETMQRLEVTDAFASDEDFAAEGFTLRT